MKQSRIYDSSSRVRGTITLSSWQFIGLNLKRDLYLEFMKSVKKFLKDNSLKVVSSIATGKKHYKLTKVHQVNSLIPTYSKFHNPRTGRIELKLRKEIK